jgi:antirestriction protein ArdC
VRKGEKGSLVVYADTFTKKDTDDKGADIDIEIPFMKGYTTPSRPTACPPVFTRPFRR